MGVPQAEFPLRQGGFWVGTLEHLGSEIVEKITAPAESHGHISSYLQQRFVLYLAVGVPQAELPLRQVGLGVGALETLERESCEKIPAPVGSPGGRGECGPLCTDGSTPCPGGNGGVPLLLAGDEGHASVPSRWVPLAPL